MQAITRFEARHTGLNWILGFLLFLSLAGCDTGSKPSGPQSNQAPSASNTEEPEDPFVEAMNRGKNYYDTGDAAKALQAFEGAVKLNATDVDARMNLANAFLLANQPAEALPHLQEVLNQNASHAGALFLQGCVQFRLSQWEPALKSLQQAYDLNPEIVPVGFFLGQAHQKLEHWDDARVVYEDVLIREPRHPSAHYALSQVWVRLEQPQKAQEALNLHQQILSALGSATPSASDLERCLYTEIKVPFKLQQPDQKGIPVQFVDATPEFLSNAQAYSGPVALLDINRRGQNDLFVREGDTYRVLLNSNGVFTPHSAAPVPIRPDVRFTQCLVGDIQNNRFEDVILLGEEASHAFKFATNGVATDVTRFCGLQNLKGSRGVLVDLDFTGKLDLLVGQSDTGEMSLFRNLGNFYFQPHATSGIPAQVNGFQTISIDDWNNDDIMDVWITRRNQPPTLFEKIRGGPLSPLPDQDFPVATAIATGDWNNDLRIDLLLASADGLRLEFSGQPNSVLLPGTDAVFHRVGALDFDNDGWLDLWASAHEPQPSLRIWRNLGRRGFVEVSQELGLDRLTLPPIQELQMADLDCDGDSDCLITSTQGQIKILRNQGGNLNHMMKLRLLGNRSNSTGLGVRLEFTSGTWRTIRTLTHLPLEVGIGSLNRLDSLTVRWIDLATSSVDVEWTSDCSALTIAELILPTGSCPYLYAWNGERFEFITDLLGAAPLGLPVSDSWIVESDPFEIVEIGDESQFRPNGNGDYVLQITEELREVLYLDQAQLLVVDHPEEFHVVSTSQLRPGKPFPNPTLVTVGNRRTLQHAETLDGRDVTHALLEKDHIMASPERLRIPQLRGLAEPHGVILDFGELQPEREWQLVLTGWLRFGGGIANIAASHHPDLPFPFPRLEAQDEIGQWHLLEGDFGAPVGKTKTLIYDLVGKLPVGARKLRLSAAFEIHWDQISLWEKQAPLPVHWVSPSASDLHWRGFSEYQDWPQDRPLTPDYQRVVSTPPWRIQPMGWATRYGEVDELLTDADNALVLIHSGDELTLTFPGNALPKKPEGYTRRFYLYSVGWDKDADFHVRHGWAVEPLPFHGMNDQSYGVEPRPPYPNDEWIQRYNTRWVGPRVLARRNPSTSK